MIVIPVTRSPPHQTENRKALRTKAKQHDTHINPDGFNDPVTVNARIWPSPRKDWRPEAPMAKLREFSKGHKTSSTRFPYNNSKQRSDLQNI